MIRIWIAFVILLPLCSAGIQGNYFDTIEKMFLQEEGRQATNVLQEDLAGGFDSPKEVSVTYNSAPDISIKDLTLSADFNGDNICMTVKVQSPNFNFKLDIRCDEIEAGNFEMNAKKSGRENSHRDETEEEEVVGN